MRRRVEILTKKVNHAELVTNLEVIYKKKVPMFLWGPPGIGKSRVMADFCKERKIGFKDVRISQLEPSDLRGLPNFDMKEKVCRWFQPSWLPKEGEGILFLDEMNLAPPSMQAAAYELVLDRRIGEYELPKGWVVIAAGNRSEDKANVFEMARPLKNRLIHYELLVPNEEEWTEWAIPNKIGPKIISFLQAYKGHLYKNDSKVADNSFPTPRTWEYCSHLIDGIKDYNMIKSLVSATVGEATALNFDKFIRLQRKIDIHEILENPNLYKKKITELDLRYCFMSCVSEFYQGQRTEKDKAVVLNQIFHVSKVMEPEFAVLMLRFCKRFDEPFFKNKVTKFKGFDEWSDKYLKFLHKS